ncbi:PTS N-acetylglucosamine transporter subunit IIBC [Anaerococcus sp. AGMB00486]|uniref:PTS N-acetylglucosamine transporter subunit IIBC n=2 Tax=Anaerococcus TaxID=165779 RepID=A0ABX2NC45_9FIRM|nr:MULTISPECIES: PTS N-acetylglucosamine transporter subunit IIBC [Anaerococcus]MSS77829.1 PTS N-acetylglucosamine transporter subunit IIBC [Anaerococcus porci]NVF12263.1 PTS N-acetylglucosamine transporter subunit IIBC [Anaerococcus faecalis]
MSKIIISSHHNLALGLKDTLSYILPSFKDVIAIPAYVDERKLEDLVNDALENIDKDEQIFVFTDMLGGSVNQEFAKKIPRENYYLITGLNLPLLLSVALSLQNGNLSEQDLKELIEEAKNQIIYVNDYIDSLNISEDDE